MDYESYLIEEKLSIMAISRISQIINEFIEENYYELEFAEKLKFSLQTLGNGFESGYVLSRT